VAGGKADVGFEGGRQAAEQRDGGRGAAFFDALHLVVGHIGAGARSGTLSRRRTRGPLDELTEREQEILSMMAEGHSNQAISARLVVSSRTVESHVRSVFMKLGVAESPDSSRRVLAVLAFLQT
jgi:DNA-binding NarL/FixJ family response regulator